MDISTDSIGQHLPHYLTADQRISLAQALRDFPHHRSFYTSLYSDQYLQGDGWSPLEIYDFASGDVVKMQGFVLSNSCDIAPQNSRDIPPNIVFTPILSLSAYTAALQQRGIPQAQIEAKLASIRAQAITSIFYLPSSDTQDESFVYLDRVHSVPAQRLTGCVDASKLFTLNQYGFYLLAMKLSIHFCRMHEGIARG